MDTRRLQGEIDAKLVARAATDEVLVAAAKLTTPHNLHWPLNELTHQYQLYASFVGN